jgi:chorismate synthase
MEMFFFSGIAIGFLIGYPIGLFIDNLNKKENKKNGR